MSKKKRRGEASMSLTFTELIVYLLPGFLGLWVYKRIVQEDIDQRSESTQISIALLFGMSGLLLLYLLHKILGGTEYISPQALRIVYEDGHMWLGSKITFWSSYIMNSVLTILSGAMCGYMNVRGIAITRVMSRLITRKLRLPEKTPSESALREKINEQKQRGGKIIARVYMLSEGIGDNTLYGWVSDYSDVSKEIVLSGVEMFGNIPRVNEEMKYQRRVSCINYESGIVIELYEYDEQDVALIEDNLRKIYDKSIKTFSE